MSLPFLVFLNVDGRYSGLIKSYGRMSDLPVKQCCLEDERVLNVLCFLACDTGPLTKGNKRKSICDALHSLQTPVKGQMNWRDLQPQKNCINVFQFFKWVHSI